jgi:ATP-dependent DNA helicase RecQ
MSSKCDIFLRCLEFAILNSPYSKVVLKPKQVICLEKLYLNSDVLAVLPTGFGKSLIFHLLPALLYAKKNGISKGPTNILSIVVVVSPLNALIMNQISKLDASGVRASALDVKYLS